MFSHVELLYKDVSSISCNLYICWFAKAKLKVYIFLEMIMAMRLYEISNKYFSWNILSWWNKWMNYWGSVVAMDGHLLILYPYQEIINEKIVNITLLTNLMSLWMNVFLKLVLRNYSWRYFNVVYGTLYINDQCFTINET
jgi:hypothetical protein